MPTPPALAVIVPVRDGATDVVGLLDAVAAQVRAPASVVVVDDGSTDGTADLAATHPCGAHVVRQPGRGSYAARNVGWQAVVGHVDAVAFTDVDCRPDPAWLGVLADALAAGADLVAGRVRQRLSARPTVWERYDAATYLDQEELVTHAGFGATANLAVRSVVLERTGGFDVSLRSSGDLELGRRCRAAGYRLAYEPDAVVDHAPRATAHETWRLHRRLGAGWAALARRDGGPGLWDDERLRPSLGAVVDRVGRDGRPPLRRRHLAGPHALVVAARFAGRVTGR